jgi:hypothetical protein
MGFVETMGLSPEIYEEIKLSKSGVEGVHAIKKLTVSDIIQIQDDSITTKAVFVQSDDSTIAEPEYQEVEDKMVVISRIADRIFPKVSLESLAEIPSVIEIKISDEQTVTIKNMDAQTTYKILKGNSNVAREVEGKKIIVTFKDNRTEMIKSILEKSDTKVEDLKSITAIQTVINKFVEVVNIEQLDVLYDYFCKEEGRLS